jgi:hypothetical protein
MNKRKSPIMDYSQHYCGCENVIVRYPRKAIDKGAEMQRKEWIEKVKNDPELQKEYDPETGRHR